MSAELSFCPDCNNLLFPREDAQAQRLQWQCRRCDYVAVSDPNDEKSNAIETINFSMRYKEELIVSKLLALDPTLGRTKGWHCDVCDQNEAVFFQIPERICEDAMNVVFVCTNRTCNHWERQVADAEHDDAYDMSDTEQKGPGVQEEWSDRTAVASPGSIVGIEQQVPFRKSPEEQGLEGEIMFEEDDDLFEGEVEDP